MNELKSVLKRLQEEEVALSRQIVELREDPRKLEKQAQDAYSSSIKEAGNAIREAINKLEAATKEIKSIQDKHGSEYGKMQKMANDLGIDLDNTEVGKTWLKIGDYLNKLSKNSVDNSTKLAGFKF